MSVALEIEGATVRQERIALRAGQVATVGRSPWVDISLPAADLENEHFRLDCRTTSCRLYALNGTVLRNGVQTDSAVLIDGDSLSAGNVQFRVHIFGLTNSRPETVTADSSDSSSETSDEFAAILQRAGLSPEVESLIVVGNRLGTLDALLAAGHLKEACHFAAACLPPVSALDWAVGCLDGAGLLPEEHAQLAAYIGGAENALTAEELDRQIASLPPAAPRTWLWKAARWSRGSLTSTGLPPVPPAPHLFAVALTVSMTLAASQRGQDTFVDWITLARESIAGLTGSEEAVSPSELTTSRD